MTFDQFQIGKTFYSATGAWRCTDIGTRVVVAVKEDDLLSDPCKGPPFSVEEVVFDEYDIIPCTLAPQEDPENPGL